MTGIDPELFSPVGNKAALGQRGGRIKGQLRNSAEGITAGHANRAGHRLYVKVNQNRQFRKNVVGFGRWRRGHRLVAGEESWALQTAGDGTGEPRWSRRPRYIAQDKASRKAGLRPGWRRP